MRTWGCRTSQGEPGSTLQQELLTQCSSSRCAILHAYLLLEYQQHMQPTPQDTFHFSQGKLGRNSAIPTQGGGHACTPTPTQQTRQPHHSSTPQPTASAHPKPAQGHEGCCTLLLPVCLTVRPATQRPANNAGTWRSARQGGARWTAGGPRRHQRCECCAGLSLRCVQGCRS
jgi:hypothetical protein